MRKRKYIQILDTVNNLEQELLSSYEKSTQYFPDHLNYNTEILAHASSSTPFNSRAGATTV